LACRTFCIRENCYRYERRLSDKNTEIADWFIGQTKSQHVRRYLETAGLTIPMDHLKGADQDRPLKDDEVLLPAQ